jgi:myo-inositol catabolism protein IolC
MAQKLYVLPFDHRGSFIKMFGFSEKDLTPGQAVVLADYKHVVYEGFLGALKAGVPKESAAILVDERFGAKIQQEAKILGVRRILPVEKTGQDEFDFEYGDSFREHIEKFQPDYVKVLVRYNSDNDPELNLRQSSRLKIISDFCHQNNYRFLFELLATPTSAQLAECSGDLEEYEKKLQSKVMKAAVKELQDSGTEPDIWKLEGMENFNDMKNVVDQARSGGRQNVGVVVLGRGESDSKVRAWLTVAAKIKGVVGFAVGRTVFKQALLDYHQKIINREQAAAVIAQNYQGLVALFESIL